MPVDFPNKLVHTAWSSMCAAVHTTWSSMCAAVHTTWSSMCAAVHTASPVIHNHVIQLQHLSNILKSFINYINSGQYLYICDRDSSVGMAIRYGLESPGFESRWGQDFPYPARPVLVPTQPPVQLVPGLI